MTDCDKTGPAGEEYAVQVAHGWDTVQEAFNLVPLPKLEHDLEKAKAKAQELDDAGKGACTVELAGEPFQVAPHGAAGGKRFVIKNDDFMIMVGSAKSAWQVSVRYLSAGLWEHGPGALSARAFDLMYRAGFAMVDPKAKHQGMLSRADYAFDYHCPAFTKEMRPSLVSRVVCHSEVKVQYVGTSVQGQTLTLGSAGSLQIQVYDKTTEIREASGKEWMRDMWARETGLVCDHDVWRIEVRMWKDWLRERRIRTLNDALAARADLVSEALYSRRLVVRGGDSNRRRRAVHPLWSKAIYQADGQAMIPLGRTTTLKREEMKALLTRQIAGTARALQVCDTGEFSPDQSMPYMASADDVLKRDGSNRAKVAKLQERYRPEFFDEAR